MKPPTPFTLEILRRIHAAERKHQPTSGYVAAWPYPLQQLRALERRGLVTRAGQVLAHGSIDPDGLGGYVRLTAAGRVLLSPPVDAERLPDWVELDDLPVLDEETASWPLREELL